VHKYDCARSKHIERIPFLTAKTQRARTEQQTNKTKEEIEQIAERVVDAMLKVHRALGPGLLESAYQTCLALELRCRDIEVGCEVALPVRYEVIEIEEREGMRKSTSSPTAFLAFLASSR
jgi:hypothetical protein